jgi:hypothetical protein
MRIILDVGGKSRRTTEVAGTTGTLPPRLTVGEHGRVLPGDPNNVRIQPSRASEVLDRVSAGNTFWVMAGPVCADGYVWWQVEYSGIIGWTAEGDATDYWLAPVP